METRKNLALRVKSKLSLIRQLLKLGLTNQEARQLYQFIDWLMTIPEDLMLTYKEKVNEIANEADDDIMEEWDVPYVPSSVKIARIEGEQKGIRMMLDKLIRRRFPHTVTAKHLHLINDADATTLTCWAERLIDAKTVDEVFATSAV
ncbi:MAG: hypothetical protein K2W99_00670 [Chthoniobacterales bacterium]|nr:hypothetical protein [Chthoniobacterales bacterium]